MKNSTNKNSQFVSWHSLRLHGFLTLILLIIISSACTKKSQEYTRGIGIYPGNVNEDFSPEMVIEKTTYRNLALRRPAYHSSSYDYNLTAQLVTDGIIDTRFPNWISAATSVHGTLKKNEREWVIDHNTMTTIDIEGSGGWIQVEIGGGETVPEVDRIDVGGRIRVDYDKANGWEFKVLGSDDGQSWEELGRTSGRDCIGEEFR